MNSENNGYKCNRDGTGRNTFRGWLPVAGAYLMIFALLKWPDTAKQAAQKAMEQWYRGVAPVLFPFMMLIPLITGTDALRIYEAALGKAMGVLFRLPGAAAPAVIIGMIAGSPACAAAAGRTAGERGLCREQLLRVTGCMCGMSPAFLVTVVGRGLLNDPGAGIMLLKSQMTVQLIMLFVTRNTGSGTDTGAKSSYQSAGSAGGAVLSVLGVAEYMVFFGILAAVVNKALGDHIGRWIICPLEVTAGSAFIAGTDIPYTAKLTIMSAMLGFGGVSICAQNMKILAKYGIRLREFLPWRAAGGALSAVVANIMMGKFRMAGTDFPRNWLVIATISVVILAVPALIGERKHIS